jgi:hypothetical protein
MSSYQVAQPECSNQIDYSQIIFGDRIVPFVFELDLALSILNPPAGHNQRFCYRVSGVGENISTFVSLNYWVLSLCPEITLDQITNIEVTIGGKPQTVIIGDNVDLIIPPDKDSETGCAGLKFNFGLSKVLNAQGSVGLFCFELITPYAVGATNVCVKASQVTSSALAICGPVCGSSEICSTSVSQLVNVCVPITIEPTVHVGPTTTTCCGPAVIGTVPCRGIPGGSCTFTVSQLIRVVVPVDISAAAISGEAFVICGKAESDEFCCSGPEKDDF